MTEAELKALLAQLDLETMDQFQIHAEAMGLNDRPIEDFCGLTPNQMNALARDPFGPDSPLIVAEQIEDTILDNVPFLRLAEEFLQRLQQEGTMKMTATGALRPAVVKELYNLRLLPEHPVESGITKLSKEIDSIVIHTLHIVLGVAGLIEESSNRMSLTETGRELMRPERRRDLFLALLENMVVKFNWAYNDGYESQQAVQYAGAYTIYLLLLFGTRERPIEFYADRYQQAFPMFVEEFEVGSPHRIALSSFRHCYYLRTFNRFLEWFGFAPETESLRLPDRLRHPTVATDVVRGIFGTRG